MQKEGVLYPFSELDCLAYYARVIPRLKSFVGERELATKTFVPDAKPEFIVHRGSADPKLTVSEFGKISKKLLELRQNHHLHDVLAQLSNHEHLIWRYFAPRKLIELHYACNFEDHTTLDRIVFDFDPDPQFSFKQVQHVVKTFIATIQLDRSFTSLFPCSIHVVWTGRGFHVYLFFKKSYPKNLYLEAFSWGKKHPTRFEQWCSATALSTGISVVPHHERMAKKIVIDSSISPPGKIVRAPYSLYLSSEGILNGVSVPLSLSALDDVHLHKKLQALTPDFVIDHLSSFKI